MAHYKITSLNYMTSGAQRGLLNIDYILADSGGDHIHILAAVSSETSSLITETGPITWKKTDYIKQLNSEDADALALQDSDKSAVLNEYQPYALSAEDSPKQEIRIFIDCDTKELCARSSEFNEAHKFKNQTFQFDKIQKTNSKSWISNNQTNVMPMYDLMDLCIKSSVKKEISNDILGLDMNVDQYTVLESQPIIACQTDAGGAFVMTEPTTSQNYILNTSLRNDRGFITEEYSMEYVKQTDKACLYDLDAISSASLKNYAQAAQYFEPARIMRGIEYNKFIELDQNSGKNPTVYDSGDTYGDAILAKNHLDPLYSMNMPNGASLTDCRSYCGAHKSNKYIVLKYYDNIDYSASSQSSKNTAMNQVQRPALPYQKVEFLKWVNNSSDGSRMFHKSNLFSVRIKNTGLENPSAEAKEKADRIKTDISRIVREVAENICPANTQLFDVYMVDE